MGSKSSMCIRVLTLLSFSVLCLAKDFDFFYFVQQWPPSYCNTRRSCCYSTAGTPAANFSIHGLWPNYADGTYPQNCDPRSRFDRTQIMDLTSRMEANWPTLACPSSSGLGFWSHEWLKHGTCSENVLNEHDYFKTGLDLKDRVDLLKILMDAGINPDGKKKYSLSSIQGAIKEVTLFTPGIECNVDKYHNVQLYEIYLCVDTSGSEFINCPILPRSGRCANGDIGFPPFDSTDNGVAAF